MIKFPFTTLQQCNLDWIMQQLHKILDFMPLNGSPGDVLQRNVDGAAWMPIAAVSMDIHGLDSIADVSPADELPIYDNSLQGNFKVSVSDLLDSVPVQSVNGMTGDVILDYADVGALPDTTVIPDSTSDLVNDSGFVDAAGAAVAAPVQSVNGQTGSVSLTIPDSTSDLVNDSGFVNAAGAAAAAPVQSVNGQTGAVVITPGGGGMEATLLWTNSAPTSTFAAQSVALDLSTYSFVLIEYTGRYFNMQTAFLPCPQITPPAGYSANCVLASWYPNGANYCLAYRLCEVNTTGIDFDSGSRMETYNGNMTTDDSVSRPTRIWGIK